MDKCIVCETSKVVEISRNGLLMFECQDCGLVWRREFDVEIEHYQNDTVSLKKENLERRDRNVSDRVSLIEKYITPNNLCDIGAGEGMFLLELSKRGYKNVVGIEPNKNALAFAKSKGLDVYDGVLADLPSVVKEKKIHTVSMFHVIEHLSDPLGALKIIYDSLSSGDYLIIETPNSKGFSFVKSNHQHPLVYQQHLFYFNLQNLELLLKKIGFQTVAQGKRGFDQYHLNIRHSLFCLGFGKPQFLDSKSATDEHVEADTTPKKNDRDSFVRSMVRGILSRLVVLLGRVDYQWIIARKP